MENNPRGNPGEDSVVDLKGVPTEYIKEMIVSRPDDPRFSAALRELSEREVRVGVPEVPDHVIAEMFQQGLGPSDCYEKIPWLRDTSLQALSYLNPKKSRDFGEVYEVLMAGACWRFALRKNEDGKSDQVWVLISVSNSTSDTSKNTNKEKNNERGN